MPLAAGEEEAPPCGTDLLTIAYDRGFVAGRRGYGVERCPYEGSSDGSLSLMVEWLNGNFDGLTAPADFKPPQVRRLKSADGHIIMTRRRACNRKRWPRSEYAARRLREILAETRAARACNCADSHPGPRLRAPPPV